MKPIDEVSTSGLIPNISKNIQNWRKQFLENVECVFDKEQLLREYKSELRSKNEQADELYRQIGKLTAQVDWAKKKVGELGLEY